MADSKVFDVKFDFSMSKYPRGQVLSRFQWIGDDFIRGRFFKEKLLFNPFMGLCCFFCWCSLISFPLCPFSLLFLFPLFPLFASFALSLFVFLFHCFHSSLFPFFSSSPNPTFKLVKPFDCFLNLNGFS